MKILIDITSDQIGKVLQDLAENSVQSAIDLLTPIYQQAKEADQREAARLAELAARPRFSLAPFVTGFGDNIERKEKFLKDVQHVFGIHDKLVQQNVLSPAVGFHDKTALDIMTGLANAGLGEIRAMVYHKSCDDYDPPPFMSTTDPNNIDLPEECDVCGCEVHGPDDVYTATPFIRMNSEVVFTLE